MSRAAGTEGTRAATVRRAPGRPSMPAAAAKGPGLTSARQSRRAFFTTFGGVLTLLLVANGHLFTAAAAADDGDFAANSLLVDKAKVFELLTGNYSRFGFNHPGPAFLYVQAAGETVFYDLLHLAGSPFAGQNLGLLVLNALLVALGAAVVVRRAGVAAATAFVGGVLVLAVSEAGVLSSSWMPDLYIWPFALFAVATASLVADGWRDLWVFVLAGSLLVHGHVSFVLFVGVGVLTVVVAALARRSALVPPTRREVLPAAALGAVFALPLVLHVLLDWPGEFGRYWAYTQSDAAGVGSLSAGTSYVLGLVRIDGPVGIVALAALVALFVAARRLPVTPQRRFADGLLVATAALAAAGIFYAARVIDDLSQRYIGLFLVGLPLMAVTAAVVYVQVVVPWRRPLQLAGLLALGLLAAVTVHGRAHLANPYRGSEDVVAMYAAVQRAVPSGELVLSFDTSAWPPAVGLLERARRDHRAACVLDPFWAFMVTSASVCTPAEQQAGTTVRVRSAAQTPLAPTLYQRGSWSLAVEP